MPDDLELPLLPANWQPAARMGAANAVFFPAEDIAAYLDSYLIHRFRWGVQDHTKPNLASSRTQRSDVFRTEGATACSDGARLWVSARMPEAAVADFGAPPGVTWLYEDDGAALLVTLFLTGKAANRQPEAGFCHVEPMLRDDSLRLEKMGLMIDPSDIPVHGNRQLHSVKAVVAETPEGMPFRVTPLDAGLFGLSSLPFLNHATDLPDTSKGGRFVLLNNKWGTNFTMWTEGDMAFRFRVDLG